MSDFNIPIIEPTVDYAKVPSINQKRTIAFINHFIAQTITFLNKFALSCEENLFEFENKIQRVEASLEILEARLSSIPNIENVSQAQSNQNENENKTENVQESKESEEAKEIVQIDEPQSKESNEPQIEETKTQPISSYPVYAKYFKMIHFGVPKQAVKLKMEQEGLDPSLLDDPQLPVPKMKSNNDAEGGES